ncbi:MAG: hypothetical protein MUF32_00005, partial [Burkholderiaceae bacterium]|nr:hypothetical protein [Burkholderiaceae bacterium]
RHEQQAGLARRQGVERRAEASVELDRRNPVSATLAAGGAGHVGPVPQTAGRTGRLEPDDGSPGGGDQDPGHTELDRLLDDPVELLGGDEGLQQRQPKRRLALDRIERLDQRQSPSLSTRVAWCATRSGRRIDPPAASGASTKNRGGDTSDPKKEPGAGPGSCTGHGRRLAAASS